jgi:DNA polymerase-3 subunit delta
LDKIRNSKKNINIENTAITLLKKYYEGEIFFIYKILEILPMIWPNSLITRRHIKKIISNFSSFSAYHWINAIFNCDKKQALYILNIFHKKKYNALILIRALQKKLLTLIIEKRKKHFTNKKILKNKYVFNETRKHLKQIDQNQYHNIFFYAIKILVQIEIKIKKQYSYSIWMQLKKLTLILCTCKKTL